MSKPHLAVVTIATRGYVGGSEILMRSIKRHNPDAQLFVLIVDALPGEYSWIDWAAPLTLSDLVVHAGVIDQMKLIYSAFELCCALKPFALEYVLEASSAEFVAYFDSDIETFAPLDLSSSMMLKAEVVLSPHMFTPLPVDDHEPSSYAMLQAGAFNGGFIGCTQRSQRFLAWWRRQLSLHCLDAPNLGLFVDQRWLDQVPVLFDLIVVTDTGWNVAYWNLHERTLSRNTSAGVLVDDRPLTFFHFSGADPANRDIISKYFTGDSRVDEQSYAIARGLVNDYVTKLEETRPRLVKMETSYRFSHAESIELKKETRFRFRRYLMSFEGEPVDVQALFRHWYCAPQLPTHPASIQLEDVWEARADLRDAFPDLSRPSDNLKLALWACEFGVQEGAISKHDAAVLFDFLGIEPDRVVEA